MQADGFAKKHQNQSVGHQNNIEELCILDLFKRQVEKTPEKIAVVLPSFGRETIEITYQELDRRANYLAELLQRQGITPGALVALMMKRAIEQIVAILGILKAGAVYVPLDPSYPQERLTWMLEDCQANCILTQSNLINDLSFSKDKIICLDENWGRDSDTEAILQPVAIAPNDLAYVNYTSGSTGRPKGVAIPHRGVVRLVFGNDYTPLDDSQTLLQLAPIS
ncbi:MAG: AMP-binding protein, partial [Xenococcaceae cyanobacterium]